MLSPEMNSHCRLLLLALLALLAGCSHPPANELVVGMELGYPPFEMTDEKGAPSGVSVELARALGKALDRPLRIENMGYAGLIPALKTGKIDLIISSMTATPERAKSIAFSEPYLKTGLCLLVPKNSAAKTIADLDQAGQTVAVKQGTTGQAYAAAHLHQAKVLVLDQEAAAVLEVVQGKVGGFIYDQMSTYQNWKRNAETTRAILEPFQTESWAVGARLEDKELVAKVNSFLSTFRAQKGFEALGDRFLREQKDAFRALGYPFFF